jgi:hypothetical protein
VAALALVGLGAFLLMRHIGTTQAIDNAKEVTRVVGRGRTFARPVIARARRIANRFASVAVRANCHRGSPNRRPSSASGPSHRSGASG